MLNNKLKIVVVGIGSAGSQIVYHLQKLKLTNTTLVNIAHSQ
ncbi:hypothetical protein [Sulfurimonas sp.]|jgi:cell division GTPase FtsZ|nr:hypothetical protein [Sulfurimonas sp.]